MTTQSNSSHQPFTWTAPQALEQILKGDAVEVDVDGYRGCYLALDILPSFESKTPGVACYSNDTNYRLCSFNFSTVIHQNFRPLTPDVCWDTLPVDTLVWVSSQSECPDYWTLRRFALWLPCNHRPYITFTNGQTRDAADDIHHWEFCRVAAVPRLAETDPHEGVAIRMFGHGGEVE